MTPAAVGSFSSMSPLDARRCQSPPLLMLSPLRISRTANLAGAGLIALVSSPLVCLSYFFICLRYAMMTLRPSPVLASDVDHDGGASGHDRQCLGHRHGSGRGRAHWAAPATRTMPGASDERGSV